MRIYHWQDSNFGVEVQRRAYAAMNKWLPCKKYKEGGYWEVNGPWSEGGFYIEKASLSRDTASIFIEMVSITGDVLRFSSNVEPLVTQTPPTQQEAEMTGQVYDAVVIATRLVAVADNTPAVASSEVVHTKEAFVAPSADLARAVVLAEYAAGGQHPLLDPKVTLEVKLRAWA